MKTYTHHHQVSFGECDPAGIVYYPNFFRLFDGNCELLFCSVGLNWKEILGKPELENIAGFPIVNTGAEFIEPVSFGDQIVIETSIPNWGVKSFRTEHRILCNGRVMAKGFEVRVWTVRDQGDPSRIKGSHIPEHIKALFV